LSFEEARGWVAGRGQRSGSLERDAVEAPEPVRDELASGEVARVERLQRVPDDDLGAGDLQQLPHGDGRRPREVAALVVAGVGGDQAVGGGHQRVEEELAVLAARVPFPEVGVVEHQVVAVARRLAGEDAVVEPEQADDPVRHRAHRHERADGQVAGAEVRACGAALEAVGEQGADLG
jgi:hypothetical protein